MSQRNVRTNGAGGGYNKKYRFFSNVSKLFYENYFAMHKMINLPHHFP